MSFWFKFFVRDDLTLEHCELYRYTDILLIGSSYSFSRHHLVLTNSIHTNEPELRASISPAHNEIIARWRLKSLKSKLKSSCVFKVTHKFMKMIFNESYCRWLNRNLLSWKLFLIFRMMSFDCNEYYMIMMCVPDCILLVHVLRREEELKIYFAFFRGLLWLSQIFLIGWKTTFLIPSFVNKVNRLKLIFHLAT